MTTAIILIIVGTILVNLSLAWFLISRYRKRLVWIRDRVDVTDYNGRRILTYINRELDQIYRIQPPKTPKQ